MGDGWRETDNKPAIQSVPSDGITDGGAETVYLERWSEQCTRAAFAITRLCLLICFYFIILFSYFILIYFSLF